MSRKCLMAILAALFFLFGPTLEAQQRPTLETMLGDAGYMFNRYEELAGGVICDSWKVDATLRRTCKEELRLIGLNVQEAKLTLQRAAKSRAPALIDLFSIYEELQEIGGHLEQLATNFTDFTSESGVPYAQAASKATILAAHLGQEIKARIIAQELKLAHCKPEK